MFTLFVVLSLCADPVEVPENVRKWQKELLFIHAAQITAAEATLVRLQEEQKAIPKLKLKAAQKTAQLKKLNEQVAVAEAAVKAAEEKSPTDYHAGLSYKPQIGDIGNVGTVRIVDADDDMAVAELTGSSAYTGKQRQIIAPTNQVIIEGVDTSQWPNGTRVLLPQTFEAVRVDKASRMMVLKPFDVEKWKPVIDAEVKPKQKPESKPKAKPKAKP